MMRFNGRFDNDTGHSQVFTGQLMLVTGHSTSFTGHFRIM
ncbi:hypothetical protein JOD18_003552 [Gracilibacillus alcaliphilus]|nr:hypothetical protein [Gracilibacillus alcaliphilus]